MTSEASNLRAEAQSFRAISNALRNRGGDFLQAVSEDLAVQAADFDAQARISEVLARTDALSGRGA